MADEEVKIEDTAAETTENAAETAENAADTIENDDKEKEEEAADVVDESIIHVDGDKYNLNLFDEVYNKVRGMIKNKQFNAANWISLVIMSMEMVETLPKLHGHEKRDLVVDLMSKLIMEIPMADDDRAIVSGLIKMALPGIIDAIIDGTLGKLDLNKVAEQVGNAFDSVAEGCNSCFARCKRKRKKKD